VQRKGNGYPSNSALFFRGLHINEDGLRKTSDKFMKRVAESYRDSQDRCHSDRATFFNLLPMTR
jgi:hypothetical protein